MPPILPDGCWGSFTKVYINKKFNGRPSYRVGEESELTLKGSLSSPTSLLGNVPGKYYLIYQELNKKKGTEYQEIVK